MEYDMKESLRSCLESYEALAGGHVNYDVVATPFLDESNEPELSRDPFSANDGLKCPGCKEIYDKELFQAIKAGQANARPRRNLEEELRKRRKTNATLVVCLPWQQKYS